VIDAATLVRRLTARKYPSSGRYLFEPYELQQLIEAVQADARRLEEDEEMASYVLRKIDDALWKQFLAKAAAEQVHPMALLVRLITDYVNTNGGGR